MTRSTASAESANDQRAYGRVRMAFNGKLFLSAEDTTTDCLTINLSAGGAGVLCENPPPFNSFVLLYIDGFGRYEAVVRRYGRGVLGLEFVCGEAKRARLIDKLNTFVATGMVSTTQLRGHERVRPVKALAFTRANGERVACEVLDISLQGLSLKTNARPPEGELVHIGEIFARVARHHDEGFAVQFVDAVQPAVAAR